MEKGDMVVLGWPYLQYKIGDIICGGVVYEKDICDRNDMRL